MHCSATPEGRDVKTSEIRAWHTRDNGWSDIGCHFVVELDGAIGVGRPQSRSGAHCSGRNSNSIGGVMWVALVLTGTLKIREIMTKNFL